MGTQPSPERLVLAVTGPIVWEITHAAWGMGDRLKSLLSEGWEPFAVTEDDGASVWFRRPSDASREGDDG